MITRVPLSVPLFTRAWLPVYMAMFPRVYLCLPLIPDYSCLPMIICVYQRLPPFNHAFLPMLTHVHSCLPIFTLV